MRDYDAGAMLVRELVRRALRRLRRGDIDPDTERAHEAAKVDAEVRVGKASSTDSELPHVWGPGG